MSWKKTHNMDKTQAKKAAKKAAKKGGNPLQDIIQRYKKGKMGDMAFKVSKVAAASPPETQPYPPVFASIRQYSPVPACTNKIDAYVCIEALLLTRHDLI